MTNVSSSVRWLTSPHAARIASAMARSKWVPLFIRSDGESRIVTRRVAPGHCTAELWMAIRQRSRASLSDASGRPTRVVPGLPGDTSAWTSIR